MAASAAEDGSLFVAGREGGVVKQVGGVDCVKVSACDGHPSWIGCTVKDVCAKWAPIASS